MTPAEPGQERTDAVTPSSLASDRSRTGLHRRSRWSPPLVWWFALIALGAALSLLLTGCGSGIRAFSGGGFPIGKAVVIGRAVSAENPQIVYKGVRILLVATPPDGSSKSFQTTTDASGSFQINDVPTGQVGGAVQLTATPEDTSVRSQTLSFFVTNGKIRGAFIALPKTTFDVSQATSLTINPPVVTVRPGDTVRVNAQLRDINGNVLPVLPSLVYDANLGDVGGDGTFFGRVEGTGTLTALWYNSLSATASLVVDPDAPSLPPPPPRPTVP